MKYISVIRPYLPYTDSYAPCPFHVDSYLVLMILIPVQSVGYSLQLQLSNTAALTPISIILYSAHCPFHL